MDIGGRFPAGDTALADAVASLHVAIDDVRKLHLDATDDAVLTLVEELEVVSRRSRSLQFDVLGTVSRRELHGRDGHGSARIFERHVCQLNGAESAARHKSRRMLHDLPEIAAAYEAGEISTAHVDLLGRVHANPRVRGAMSDREQRFLADARTMAFRRFELEVQAWLRLADQDGPEPPAEKLHANRNARLLQEFNTSWAMSGTFGSMQGAKMADVFAHYVSAELLADWEEAHRLHGDDATDDDLPRTAAQRRADAMARIFADAAAFDGSPVPANSVHTVVWSAEAFEEMVRRLDPNYVSVPFDVDTFRCETVDGQPLDPNDAFADALVAKFRRAIVDAKGVTIDLGTARLFTGSARAAVQLQATECVWPGCQAPTSRCQADHLQPHAKGGKTHPGNGAPLCGRHNRLKETRCYRVWRDADGTWHTETPEGRQIE